MPYWPQYESIQVLFPDPLVKWQGFYMGLSLHQLHTASGQSVSDGRLCVCNDILMMAHERIRCLFDYPSPVDPHMSIWCRDVSKSEHSHQGSEAWPTVGSRSGQSGATPGNECIDPPNSRPACATAFLTCNHEARTGSPLLPLI